MAFEVAPACRCLIDGAFVVVGGRWRDHEAIILIALRDPKVCLKQAAGKCALVRRRIGEGIPVACVCIKGDAIGRGKADGIATAKSNPRRGMQ